MRQVSPESPDIYDFVMEVYADCAGDWHSLEGRCGVTSQEVEELLDYAAQFLSNVGNYYVSFWI